MLYESPDSYPLEHITDHGERQGALLFLISYSNQPMALSQSLTPQRKGGLLRMRCAAAAAEHLWTVPAPGVRCCSAQDAARSGLAAARK